MNNSKGLSIAALVLGIVSCVIPWWSLVCGIIGLVCGVVGLILAIKARKQNPTTLATVALILSIVGIVLSIIGIIACGICALMAAGVAEGIESGEIDVNGIANEFESAINEIATTVGN